MLPGQIILTRGTNLCDMGERAVSAALLSAVAADLSSAWLLPPITISVTYFWLKLSRHKYHSATFVQLLGPTSTPETVLTAFLVTSQYIPSASLQVFMVVESAKILTFSVKF